MLTFRSVGYSRSGNRDQHRRMTLAHRVGDLAVLGYTMCDLEGC